MAATVPHVQPLFTDEVMAGLRRVILRSRRLSSSGLSGEHRSLRKGPSPEFADLKPYTVGDDFRRIDWRAYARLGTLFVRESEIATEFDIHLVVDVSRSMDWSSDPAIATKLRRAMQFTGALAYCSLWHFDRVSITPVGSDAQRRFGPAQGRSQIRQMLTWLERLHAVREGDLVTSINRLVHERRRSGVMLIVSDFLSDDVGRLEQAMRGAIGRGWDVGLIHVVDPAEKDPAKIVALSTTMRAIDVETGAQMPIAADTGSLAQYADRREAWLGELSRLGGGARSLHSVISTEQPIDASLVRLFRVIGLVA